MRPIDADDAIKAIYDLPNCRNGFSDTYDKACIIGVLEELPTIDHVKHGEWVAKDDGTIVCSLCGDFWGRADLALKYLRYCPNCGAKMERR